MSLIAHLNCAPNTHGEIGIEIEVEGENLPTSRNFKKFWRAEEDNSLRGESQEYVLNVPVSREEVPAALQRLQKAYTDKGSVIYDTFRAGIHIHVNIQDMTPKQLMNYIFLYLMYEDILIDYCAPSRRGNHFCLRVTDAKALVEAMADAIVTGNLQTLNNENYRYASINLTALFKYGSVEFRSLESTNDWEKIQNWINLLTSLKDAAILYDNPTEIIGQYSLNGFEGFTEKSFGKSFPIIKPYINEEKIYRGIRNIQFAAYSRNWESVNLNIFKVKKDVFG